MKLSTLVELIGSGSALLLAGVLMIAFGAAYGINAATGLPLWASFTGVGLLVAVVGYGLIDRGTEETEKQVQKLSVFGALRSPWVLLGSAVAAGFVLARLTRRRRRYTIVGSVTPARDIVVNPSIVQKPIEPAEAPTTTKDASSVSQIIGDQLRSLGALASGAALTFAMKALGVPPLDQLVSELLGSDESEAKSDSSSDTEAAATDETPPQSSRTSSNGRHKETAYNGGYRNSGFDE